MRTLICDLCGRPQTEDRANKGIATADETWTDTCAECYDAMTVALRAVAEARKGPFSPGSKPPRVHVAYRTADGVQHSEILPTYPKPDPPPAPPAARTPIIPVEWTTPVIPPGVKP